MITVSIKCSFLKRSFQVSAKMVKDPCYPLPDLGQQKVQNTCESMCS